MSRTHTIQSPHAEALDAGLPTGAHASPYTGHTGDTDAAGHTGVGDTAGGPDAGGKRPASAKQVMANRRNALRSTGPQTAAGKALVARNATRHGLLSQHVLLPGEDAGALADVSARLRAELGPVGELEEALVERLVAAQWRLRRLLGVEADIFAQLAAPPTAAGPALTGSAFIRDANNGNAFSKLSRYETTIEHGFYKALHELQRLQTARGAGGAVPPPAELEVTLIEPT